MSNWNMTDFALHISILINTEPTLVDAKTFENLLKTFAVIKSAFDWDAFLTLFLGFDLFTSPFRSIAIARLSDVIVQFPSGRHASQIARFLFHTIHLIAFGTDEGSVLALLSEFSGSQRHLL
jgi:hypothetical protein